MTDSGLRGMTNLVDATVTRAADGTLSITYPEGTPELALVPITQELLNDMITEHNRTVGRELK